MQISLPNLQQIATGALSILLTWACVHNQTNSEQEEIASNQILSHEYIDPNTCRSCHAQIVDEYLKTGKGRSFYSVNSAAAMGDWRTSLVFDSILNFYYQPLKHDSLFFMHEFRMEGRDTVHSRKEPVHFVIGSGNQTHSFLFQRNGYLFESPITWYSRKKIWDLSPGYENGGNFRFERPVGSECLSCHVSGYQFFEHSVNRYQQFGRALDCGSCHGSLALHVENAKNGSVKKGDVLSLKSQPNQIQLDVCRNCHLEGLKVRKENAPSGDYVPGKLLSDFFEVFIPMDRNHEFGFASHAERLQMSVCFKKSNGQLTCTSCHDPHKALPKESDLFFNAKCQQCHSSGHNQVCSKPAKSNKRGDAQNCISCHMSKSSTSDIPHVQSSDHWIRRQLKVDSSTAKNGSLRLSPFSGGKSSSRQLGLAYLTYAESFQDSLAYKQVEKYLSSFSPTEKLKYYYLTNKAFEPNLDTQQFMAVKDPTSLFQFSQLKKRAHLPWENALIASKKLAPFNVELQYKIATELMGGRDTSLYASILALDPAHVPSLSNLAYLKLEAGQKAEATRLLNRAIQLNPDYSPALENMALLFFKSGQNDKAKKILNKLLVKSPNEQRYKQILDLLP